MRKVLIDTNVYVAFKRAVPEITKLFRHFDFIGIPTTVLAELYAGFKCGNRESFNRNELEAFMNSPRVHFVSHTKETAEFYAFIYHFLRAKGKPIPSNDIWIAASAMEHGCGLISFDKHFAYIDGLQVLFVE